MDDQRNASLDEDIFDDEPVASGDQLRTILALVDQQTKLESEVAAAEATLKARKASLTNVSEKLLPDALANAKLSGLPLADGRVVKLEERMEISVPKKRLEEICTTLTDWGNSGLISNTIVVTVPKGADDKAAKIVEAAIAAGLDAERTKAVNSGSLKKVLRDRLKEGKATDLAFFGAFSLQRAVIDEK